MGQAGTRFGLPGAGFSVTAVDLRPMLVVVGAKAGQKGSPSFDSRRISVSSVASPTRASISTVDVQLARDDSREASRHRASGGSPARPTASRPTGDSCP